MKKNRFEIRDSKKFSLKKIPTSLKSRHSDAECDKRLEENRERLAEMQTRLYAARRHCVLIIFQGMDTSGKDGAIRHVMTGVNPQGCTVTGFKTPSPEELEHDFLWKATTALPARGQIGIFNRSYYEEILITKVHPELLDRENLPGKKKRADAFWRKRYEDIVHFEKHLERQGYEIIKIFLHISKDEQKKRLLARFADPQKLWKISESDVRERSFWNDYQHAYEDSIRNTATEKSPWYVVPGDDKKSAHLAISQILVERLERLKLEYPKLSRKQEEELARLRELLD
jgi:PPK2 family polyphosphate:nucleotide phosphotransferase